MNPMASNSAGHVLTAPFNKSIKVTGHHSEKLTSDAGVLLLRSLFMLTGLTARLAAILTDSRIPGRITHRFDELLQSVLLLLAQGRMRQRDMRRLRHDPAMRLAVSMKAGMGGLKDGKPLASQPTISRLLRRLGTKKNLARLSDFVTTFAMERLLHARGGKRYDTLVMDIDGLPVDAHGRQQGSAYNGHYKRNIFLPLIASCAETGDMLGATLRRGNAHVLNDCYNFIKKIALRLRTDVARKVIVRLDAAFNSGALCSKLERIWIGYIMRLKENDVLAAVAEPYLSGVQPEEEQCYAIPRPVLGARAARRLGGAAESRGPVPRALLPDYRSRRARLLGGGDPASLSQKG